jgi:hypothetical protein
MRRAPACRLHDGAAQADACQDVSRQNRTASSMAGLPARDLVAEMLPAHVRACGAAISSCWVHCHLLMPAGQGQPLMQLRTCYKVKAAVTS